LATEEGLFDSVTDVYDGVSKKFSDWPPGARTANSRALCP